tara:strand:+ start:7574 stop:8209 length:636 start_codon:yes stop_codon:yes gene_type:complete
MTFSLSLNMAIEIKITPRKIERTILIIIILVLLGALYQYGYKTSVCETPSETTEEVVPEAEPETEATVEEEVVEPTPEPVVAAPTPSTTSGNLDGKVKLTVSSLDVDKEGDIWIIDDFNVRIANGKDGTISNLKLNFYKPYNKDEIEFAQAFKPLNSNPISIPPIISAGSYSNSFRLTIPMKMYTNEEHTVKFEIIQEGKVMATVKKTVHP